MFFKKKPTITGIDIIEKSIQINEFTGGEIYSDVTEFVTEIQKYDADWKKTWNIKNLENTDSKVNQVKQWWTVSELFAEKFEEKGEIILERFGELLWGRTSDEEGFSNDAVINEMME